MSISIPTIPFFCAFSFFVFVLSLINLSLIGIVIVSLLASVVVSSKHYQTGHRRQLCILLHRQVERSGYVYADQAGCV